MKRVLSVMLVLLLLAGMLPTGVMAEKSGSSVLKQENVSAQWPTLNTDLTHIICYGQSFSTGSDAPVYPDPGVDGVYVYGNIANSSNGTALTPLATTGNQHPIISAGNVLAQLLSAKGYDTDIILGSYGSGGRTIAQLMSEERQAEIQAEEGYTYDCLSSGCYTVFENSVGAISTYAASNGKSVGCPAIVYLQGETDQNTDAQLGYPDNPNRAGYGAGGDKEKYKEYMSRLKEDMQQEVMAQYGQTEKPLFFIYQVSGTYTRTQYSSINMAQIEFAQENDDVILVQSPYFTSHYTNSHHLTQNGYRWLGEYIGRSMYTALVEREKPWPMLPQSIEITSSRSVRITVNGAQNGLAIDTWTVENASNSKNLYGFYLQVDGRNVVPSQVTVNENYIDLTLPDDLAAETVYVYYAGKNAAGTGNIRDNSTAVGFYEYLDDTNDVGTGKNQGVSHSALDANGQSIIGQKYPLYNWLASFCYEVEVSEAAQRQAVSYYWEMQDSGLVSVTKDHATQNELTLLQGSVDDGMLNKVQYRMEKAIVLEHDLPWAIEWKAAGNGNYYGGGKLLSASGGNESVAQYLYLPADTRSMVAWGVGSDSANYGFQLGKMGIDSRKEHTYRIENRIDNDGVNTVYLIVDGVEIGAMNTGYRTSSNATGSAGSMIAEPKNWANGKNIYMDSIGAGGSFLLSNMKLSYLKVQECVHTYQNGVCTACGDELPTLDLRYDDRYDVSGKTVEVLDAGTPTSYQVGYGVAENTVRDTAVVTLEGNTLVATGIGTAVVRIDGVAYEVTVTSAPISLLLIIGQSNAEGMEGNANQSIICPDGMVYSTYAKSNGLTGDAGLTVDNAGNYVPSSLTGTYSTVNVNGTDTKLSTYPVHSLTESGAGKYGMDSGLAYEWVKQTEEKVWVVNAAHGASSIASWQKGAENFDQAVALFSACQNVLQAEISAGHYTFSHMGYYWNQGCADETKTAEWYVNQYLAMHEDLKVDLACDMDNNPATANNTLEFGNIVLVQAGHSTATGYRKGNYEDASDSFFMTYKELEFRGPRVAQIWMANNPELSDIHIVSTLAQNWVTMPDGTDGVAQYFQSAYKNGTVDYTTQVKQSASWYTPTTPTAVKDSIHYNQIGYNEIGRESARNSLYILGICSKPDVETTVTFLNWNGYELVDTIKSSGIGTSDTLVVPLVYPCYESKTVTYTLSDGLSWNYYDLLDIGVDGGTLTASIGAQAVTVTGREYYSYRFELIDGKMVSVSNDTFRENLLTATTVNTYMMADTILLRHDKEWIVEFNSVTADRFMALASSKGTTEGMYYFFKSKSGSGVLSIGEYKDGLYQNYGLKQSQIHIDWTQPHVYRFKNVINADGTNIIHIYVDGEWVGTATNLIINDALKSTDNMYLSGKDFSFSSIGCGGFGLGTDQMTYLAVYENGQHTHAYTATVTAPTCTEQGYTTYTCECGDGYVGDYVEATGHAYENGNCTGCGIVLGDADGNGRVNNRDLGLLQRYLNGWDVSVCPQADMNGDGTVNNKDLGLLQQALNGWTEE